MMSQAYSIAIGILASMRIAVCMIFFRNDDPPRRCSNSIRKMNPFAMPAVNVKIKQATIRILALLSIVAKNKKVPSTSASLAVCFAVLMIVSSFFSSVIFKVLCISKLKGKKKCCELTSSKRGSEYANS